MMETKEGTKKQKNRESPWLNLGFNIILPSLIMSKADDWFGIEPTPALIVALAFPFGYGLLDFMKSKKCNVFSVVGFASILLTGIIGLLQLPKEYVAIKEAFIPSLLGIIVFISAFTRYPLIKTLLFNDAIMNIDLIDGRLKERKLEEIFWKLLSVSTLKFSLSFLLSAVLNYVLACYFIHSETGTVEFNKELARMTFWSYPVIVLPCTIILMATLIGLVKRLGKLTDLGWEEMLAGMQAETPNGEENSKKNDVEVLP
jgi:intracellular septation protein A